MPGQFAIARTSELRGSITIAVAPSGWNVSPIPWSTSSVRAWMLASRVNCRSLAGLGGGERAALELLAEGVGDNLALAVTAVQDGVLGGLEPGQALVLGADRADHLAGEVALRVDAAAVGEHPDPGQLELLDLLGLVE